MNYKREIAEVGRLDDLHKSLGVNFLYREKTHRGFRLKSFRRWLNFF